MPLKRLAATAAVCALVPSTALADAGPQGIRVGHNITVFHDIDMIGTFGQAVGKDVQVDVFRGPHLIASVTGPAVSSPDGGALEVNHGPAGLPAPGDCFVGATPDIRPGDRVVVSNPGGEAGVDEAVVDDIAITSRRLLNVDPATGAEVSAGTPGARQEVWVEGNASFMNPDGTTGGPIPVAKLDSGGFIDLPADNQLRVSPSLVDAPNGPGTFRARYFADPGFNLERNRNGHPNSYILNALATGDAHSMGYGHVVPLPPVSMLVDGMTEQLGPALGCEAAPKEPSSAGALSTRTLNAANAGAAAADPVLTVGGWAAQSVSNADVVLSDGAASVVQPATLGGGNGQQGWSATFTKADLGQLAQGALTAQLRVAGAPVGAAQALAFDTVAPVIDASLPEGEYTGGQTVRLSAGKDAVTYSLDGAPSRRTLGEAIELAPGTRTLDVRATDGAGNVTTRVLRYVVNAPVAAPAPAAPALTAPAPVVIAAPAPARAKALAARNLRVARSTRLRTARSRGIAVGFTAPAEAVVARVWLVGTGGRTVAGKTIVLERAGSQTLHLRARRVDAGRYSLRVALGAGAASLGRAVAASVRLVR